MPPCACADRTSVVFTTGVELLRCSAHDSQTWRVRGRTTTRAVAVAALRDAFQDRTGAHGRRRTASRPSGVPARVVTLPDATSPVPSAEALTALLHARGLTGSWATT